MSGVFLMSMSLLRRCWICGSTRRSSSCRSLSPDTTDFRAANKCPQLLGTLTLDITHVLQTTDVLDFLRIPRSRQTYYSTISICSDHRDIKRTWKVGFFLKTYGNPNPKNSFNFQINVIFKKLLCTKL